MRSAHARMVGLMLHVVVTSCVTSCVTASAAGGSGMGGTGVITAAELEQHPGEELLALILRARPSWVHARPSLSVGEQDTNPIVVVIDGVPQEPGLDPLRGFKVADVREVSRLSASDATTRFGTNMTAGAILVATKR